MSKKKASSVNTMTLKDFHGGSIPSDLPLPSAPGVVRPTDRIGFDRPTPWGNPMNRSDNNRTRPSSSPGIRNHFDDKTPFSTHTARIGRNFDEDERKPLDGVSVPRRTVSDESYRAAPNRVESASSARFSGSASVSPWSSVVENSYAGRVSEVVSPVSVTSDNNNSNLVTGSRGTYPNAWGVRKEVISEPAPERVSAVSKMAHASALDKVTSGRWLSNKSGNYQPDVDVNGYSEMESALHSKGYSEVKERKQDVYTDVVQNARPYGGPEKQPATTSSDLSERPKLKLLPRTKPSEIIEPPAEPNLDYQWPKDYDHHGPLETISEVQGNMNPAKPVLAGNETGNQAIIERPKLNIKPRSQPLESYVGHPERERNGLFGGARPREAVLRERGVDDVAAINTKNLDSDRMKPRTEKVGEHGVSSSQHSVSSVPGDERNLKKKDRVDVDSQRRNDKWREPQREASPETWRKTVADDDVGLRHGKAASAVDLALSFSKSHLTDDERYTRQRDHSDQGAQKKPFSRLTAPAQRPRQHQINGY